MIHWYCCYRGCYYLQENFKSNTFSQFRICKAKYS